MNRLNRTRCSLFATSLTTSMLVMALLLPTLFLPTNKVWAETIVIGVGQQGSSTKQIAKPNRGMSRTDVKQQFGEPLEVIKPTAKPPIETWKYAKFSVYFEGDYVIHSVLQHTPKNPVNNTKK